MTPTANQRSACCNTGEGASNRSGRTDGLQMNAYHRIGLWALAFGVAAGPAIAAGISDITWTSNEGAYINDTIVNGSTSPLAFTPTADLAQPFLNESDSTITLSYGSYYAISFRNFGAHIGPGSISFVLDGVTYSQNVVFPDPTSPSGVFASFALPGGDFVTVSATGLSADRIRIIADGSGLAGDGTPDAFYQFNYFVIPKLTIRSSAPGQVTISWDPPSPGFVLQESLILSPVSWENSPSGATNPVVLPATLPKQFYRLFRP
ncbi:hypothetical protein HZ994_00455 [Akkermansiaceae bacterium]|nr:hypothetical protein HZ994_00455 [Akkermansiaceae bacterium]